MEDGTFYGYLWATYKQKCQIWKRKHSILNYLGEHEILPVRLKMTFCFTLIRIYEIFDLPYSLAANISPESTFRMTTRVLRTRDHKGGQDNSRENPLNQLHTGLPHVIAH